VKKEKITETKFVAYSPAKFYFYYSSKSRKMLRDNYKELIEWIL
jgi:hypothetical protein